MKKSILWSLSLLCISFVIIIIIFYSLKPLLILNNDKNNDKIIDNRKLYSYTIFISIFIALCTFLIIQQPNIKNSISTSNLSFNYVQTPIVNNIISNKSIFKLKNTEIMI